MIPQMAFMTAAELQDAKDSLETWSGLCVDQLAEIETRKHSALQIDTTSKDQ